MNKGVRQTDGLRGERLPQDRVHKPNLEKLVAFAEEQDDDGTLIPVFLAILEMCFQSQEHSL